MEDVYALASAKCHVCSSIRNDIDISNTNERAIATKRAGGEHVEFEVTWKCGNCLHWNKSKFSVNTNRHSAIQI